MRYLLILMGLTFSTSAFAQTGNPVIDSPAAYREQGLHSPEHARLVRELLRYELRNLRSLVASQVQVRPEGYTFTFTNRATIAEITEGTYTMTYYNAQSQVVGATKGRFGGLAPGASRNQSVTFARPADTARTEISVTTVQAE
ncbi:hypothetical protein [Hymenobacter arizonensis]|uniref:Uncharacterized protein n=1 Tax=Hymenobacter arizonensis TaxID=1227077 RepID=A0A1I5USV1_HYMAR|nr:hypothetical protein [Hymenobacter arizonensis]SFP98272.1 hypothetical protein SAMN04515668_1057 [Hymenobacter arizonensis]